MLVNFDEVFEKFHSSYDWTKVNLTDNPPCATCKHSIFMDIANGATIAAPPKECDGCVKRLTYITDCLMKLRFYENKEKHGV
jgi:hypothetical protein